MAEPFVRLLHDADGALPRFIASWKEALHFRGAFCLCLGGTGVSDIEGISAAGVDGSARRMTPAIDAEAVVLGYPVTSSSLPRSPEGIVSPVVLSRAMLALTEYETKIFDCGSFFPPQVSSEKVGEAPAACLDEGAAMPEAAVRRLFANGRLAGQRLARRFAHLIIGECVPGGTTTAAAVLTALGYSAEHLTSSSLPTANHDLRQALIARGLSAAEYSAQEMREQPLKAVAAVGDPMQPFAAGLALEASRRVPVVLGGGTQMLAVHALLQAFSARQNTGCNRHNLAVITTKWVALEAGGRAVRMAELLGAQFAAACPDFKDSRHYGLRAYEEGHVKEGVAAGALIAAAYLKGAGERQIMQAVDDSYDAMVSGIEQLS